MEISHYIEIIAKGVEVIGVAIISLGTLISLAIFLFTYPKAKHQAYKTFRQNLGKAILLGLEVLVAADIIATVVTEPTMNKVLTLGVIVLIRTFLSLSLQVELEGQFPWQKKNVEEDQI